MATKRAGPSSREVFAQRLAAQRVSVGALDDPAAVVGWLGAVQAQDYRAALWAIGLRTKKAREGNVERAIAERRVVRTWPMRGTLHFVAAADARWMTELLAPRPLASAAGRLRGLGIDRDVLARARRALVRALEGGRVLTRPDAYAVLERANIATAAQRGVHVLFCLAHERLLCFGPHAGKQPTLVLFDEWLPDARSRARDEALGELAVRYFRSHGPATLRDFVWWTGLRVTDAKEAVAIAGDRITRTPIAGVDHWTGGSALGAPDESSDSYALPAFDELLVGYADRSAALDPTTTTLVIAGGLFKPFIVARGSVVGTWKRRFEGKSVVCTPDAFPGRRRAPTRSAFERYATFVGRTLAK